MEPVIVDQPMMPPGCCALTNTSVGPFVDTGLDIDDLPNVGRIYLAESTVSHLAQLFGFTPPEASRRQRERIAELEVALADQQRLGEGLLAANRALIDAGYQPVPVTERAVHVPSGSVDDVLAWVCEPATFVEAKARAEAAYQAELLEDAPRVELIGQLQDLLTSKESV